MNYEVNVPVISTIQLHEKLQNLDDHTILTIALESGEEANKDVKN